MNSQFPNKNRAIIRAAMILMCALTMMLSGYDCGGGGDGPAGPGGGETPVLDNKLVNATATEAWVDDYAQGWRDGFILSADGKIVHISDSLSGGSTWAELGKGAWSVNEDTLKATTDNAGYYIGSATYTLSAGLDTLIFGGETLVRTSVTVGAAPTGASKARVGIKPVKRFRAVR